MYWERPSDVFDLPGLRDILGGVARREIAVHGVETLARASPFAGSLMFAYVAAYMYDGDTPIAERRRLRARRSIATCCASCSARKSCASCSTRMRWPISSWSLQALTDDRRATTLDGVHDLLRRLGDLSAAEVAARTEGGEAVADPGSTSLPRRRAVRRG